MNLEFYQALYNREFERKETLVGRANAIITLLTASSGSLAYILMNFKGGHPFEPVFYLLAIASLIVLALSAGYLIWSYTVPVLRGIEKPAQWLAYWDELVEKYKSTGPHPFATADAEFTDHLINLYAATTGANVDSNDDRGNRLNRSNALAFIGVALVTTSALYFYYNNTFLVQPDSVVMEGSCVALDKNHFACRLARQ